MSNLRRSYNIDGPEFPPMDLANMRENGTVHHPSTDFGPTTLFGFGPSLDGMGPMRQG